MGKIKGKIVKQGDSGCLQVKQDDGSWIQYDYSQPFSDCIGIVEGGVVTCSLVPSGTTQIAVAVYPIDKGEITNIDYDKGTGTIYEKESNISYTFFQNFLKESGFVKGDMVKYVIARSNNINYAVCLTKPVV